MHRRRHGSHADTWARRALGEGKPWKRGDHEVEILELWDEYEAASSPEARVAKGLDKLETILQHTQGRNPDDFDYAFNLDYGQRYTAADPVLAALRSRLDEVTAQRARDAGVGPGGGPEDA